MSQLHTGTVPLIYWAPVDPADPGSPDWTYNTILNGDHDAYITQFAQDAKAYGGRVLLRFAHEMDGDWFPWGIGRFDNTKANFILAWRHVHDIFRSVGATQCEVRLVTDRATASTASPSRPSTRATSTSTTWRSRPPIGALPDGGP